MPVRLLLSHDSYKLEFYEGSALLVLALAIWGSKNIYYALKSHYFSTKVSETQLAHKSCQFVYENAKKNIYSGR